MDIQFSKMHGLGNDFVVIDDRSEDLEFAPEAIEWICDRNFGVGADGLILIRPAVDESADYFMAYYNADGQTAEMCGNGIRCFAKYLVDHGIAGNSDAISVETLAGVKSIAVTRDDDGKADLITVDMGAPILQPSEIPTTIDDDMVVDCEIVTDLGPVRLTAISMGNPHAVIVVDDIEEAPVEELGALIEVDERFPKRTNVEFAQLVDADRIGLRVWERGVGETLACGTGACAALVAFSLLCLTGRTATVELPGGDLEIEWAEDEHVYMSGPADEVFTGTLSIPEDDEDS